MNVSKQSKQIVQTLMFVSSVMFFVVTTNVGSASATEQHKQHSYGQNETHQQNGWNGDENEHESWQEDEYSDSNRWDKYHSEYTKSDSDDYDKSDKSDDSNDSDKQWSDSSKHQKNKEYQNKDDWKKEDRSYREKSNDDEGYKHDKQSYNDQEDRDEDKHYDADTSDHKDTNDKSTYHTTSSDVKGQQHQYRYEDVKDHEYGKHLVNATDDKKSDSHMKKDNDDPKNCDDDGDHAYGDDQHKNTMSSYNNHGEYDGKKWRNGKDGSSHGRLTGYRKSWEGDHSMNQNDMAQHLALRSSMQEHAAVAMPAFRAELEQSDDREAALAAVDQNSEMVADSVEMMYPDTKDEFSDLWQTHIDAYMMAVHAERDNDESAKQEAEDKLAMFANDASDWFVSQNSDYDANTLHEMITTHGTQTLSLIEQLAAKDYDAAYKSAHEAYNHMGMLADYLATMHGKEYDHPSSNNTVDDHEVDHSSDMMNY